MKKYLLSSFLLLAFVLFSATDSPVTKPEQLLAKMLDAGKKVQALKFTLHKQERIKGKLLTEKSNVKLQQNPFKVYLNYETPNPGMEVLFVRGQNNNDAFIRPSGFPWKTISLNPKGSLMRANQHHTIFDLGFNQILNVTDFMLKKYGKQAEKMLKLNGTTTWNGINCYSLTVENPNFSYLDYTVGTGEDLLKIAAKFQISEYMILEKNPDLENYTDVKAGQKIKIPSDYASKISMLLDQKTNLPLQIKVYDDKGLFEQYEYLNLQVNPTFSAAEFTKTYKDYKF